MLVRVRHADSADSVFLGNQWCHVAILLHKPDGPTPTTGLWWTDQLEHSPMPQRITKTTTKLPNTVCFTLVMMIHQDRHCGHSQWLLQLDCVTSQEPMHNMYNTDFLIPCTSIKRPSPSPLQHQPILLIPLLPHSLHHPLHHCTALPSTPLPTRRWGGGAFFHNGEWSLQRRQQRRRRWIKLHHGAGRWSSEKATSEFILTRVVPTI